MQVIIAEWKKVKLTPLPTLFEQHFINTEQQRFFYFYKLLFERW